MSACAVGSLVPASTSSTAGRRSVGARAYRSIGSVAVAQLTLFSQLLVRAAIADSRFDLARGLIGERLERRR